MEGKFKQRLKKLRKENGEKQETLAKIIGVSPMTISGYETKGNEPKFEILIKIADHYKVTTDYLIGRSELRILFDPEEEKEREKEHKALIARIMKIEKNIEQLKNEI